VEQTWKALIAFDAARLGVESVLFVTPPCDAPPFAFRRDDIRLLVRLDLIAFCPQVEEQLLQITSLTTV
jgi:hypothetical protein